jgi:hypothetical protein
VDEAELKVLNWATEDVITSPGSRICGQQKIL